MAILHEERVDGDWVIQVVDSNIGPRMQLGELDDNGETAIEGSSRYAEIATYVFRNNDRKNTVHRFAEAAKVLTRAQRRN